MSRNTKQGLALARDGRGEYTKERVEKETRMSKTQTKAGKEGESNSHSEYKGYTFQSMLQKSQITR